MAINNSTLLEGATAAFTGGTAKTFTIDGLKVNNGVHASDTSVADMRVRPGITCKGYPATVDSKTGKWSSGKREGVVTRPKILADLTQFFPNVRIVLTDHPEMTAAEITALRLMAAELLMDPDFDSFWGIGSLA